MSARIADTVSACPTCAQSAFGAAWGIVLSAYKKEGLTYLLVLRQVKLKHLES
jgi:hypothetical protein